MATADWVADLLGEEQPDYVAMEFEKLNLLEDRDTNIQMAMEALAVCEELSRQYEKNIEDAAALAAAIKNIMKSNNIAMESIDVDSFISNEGVVGNMLSEVWRWASTFIINAIKAVFNFIVNFFKDVTVCKRHAQAQRKRLVKGGNLSYQGRPLEVGALIQSVSIAGVAPTNGMELVKNIQAVQPALAKLAWSGIGRHGDAIINLIKDFNPADMGSAVRQLIEMISFLRIVNDDYHATAGDAGDLTMFRGKGIPAQRAMDLFGDKSLVTRFSVEAADQIQELSRTVDRLNSLNTAGDDIDNILGGLKQSWEEVDKVSKQLRRSSIKVESSGKQFNPGRVVEFRALSPDESIQLCDAIIANCDTILRYEKNGSTKLQERQAKEMIRIGNKITKDFADYKGDMKVLESIWREMIEWTTFYARSISIYQPALIANVTNGFMGALKISHASMETYMFD